MESYIIHSIAFILAAIPAAIWIYVFNKHHSENKKIIIYTFCAGILSTVIILLYKYFWDQSVNAIFFEFKAVSFKESIANIFSYEDVNILKSDALNSIPSAILATFFIFIGVGAMEEYAKHWVVKIFDRPFFRSIDDVIQLSIIAALGFAFAENILYFASKWDALSSGQYGVFVFFRVTVVTMVHVLCSGIFGYYYGLAFFAAPVLQDEMKKGKKFFFTESLHRILHLRTEIIFKQQKILEGLLISVVLHAIYDFVLDLSFTFGDLFKLIGIPLDIPIGIYTIVMPLYLIVGYLYLLSLLDTKEDHKIYGKLFIREEFGNSLEANVKYTEEELTKLREEKEKMGQKVSLFQRFINDAKKEIGEKKETISVFQRFINDAKKEITEEVSEEKKIEKKLEQEKLEQEKLEQEKTELEAEKKKLEKEIKELEEKKKTI